MRNEGHIDIAKATLRGVTVTRHAVARFDGGRTFVATVGLGWPRLWAFSTEAIVSGFGEGIAKSGSARGAERLRAAMQGARERFIERCEALIERQLPDAGVIGLTLDGGELHVHAVGPVRAYLHRKGESQRISPRDEADRGILDAPIAESSMWLDPGDLIIAGSVSAFSTQAVARVASVLKQDPSTAPNVVATLLTEPAEGAGIGAASIVVRIS